MTRQKCRGEDRAVRNRQDFTMPEQFLRVCAIAAGTLLIISSAARADEICKDRMEFEKNGWQLKPVQQAMDNYLRDHRMRVNWLHEPRPPDAVGRDYYEWLWTDEFGAGMKAGLVKYYCAGKADSGRLP
jgi:hypothetical protein